MTTTGTTNRRLAMALPHGNAGCGESRLQRRLLESPSAQRCQQGWLARSEPCRIAASGDPTAAHPLDVVTLRHEQESARAGGRLRLEFQCESLPRQRLEVATVCRIEGGASVRQRRSVRV